MSNLIGPLTAEEWCSLRATGEDDDFLQCCAVTSDFRDAMFLILRMGGGHWYGRSVFKRAWRELSDHGLPLNDAILKKLYDYYMAEEVR